MIFLTIFFVLANGDTGYAVYDEVSFPTVEACEAKAQPIFDKFMRRVKEHQDFASARWQCGLRPSEDGDNDLI